MCEGEKLRVPDLFDTINDWLLAQALSEDSFDVMLKGLATRLLEGGVPVARISVGRSILHPVIGLLGAQWARDTGRVDSETLDRSYLRSQLDLRSPFADFSKGRFDTIRADLTDPR